MSSQVTSLAGQLAQALLDERDAEQRSIDLAGALMLLAESVNDSDAYTTLLNTASDILHQAQENIRMWQESKAEEAADRWIEGMGSRHTEDWAK